MADLDAIVRRANVEKEEDLYGVLGCDELSSVRTPFPSDTRFFTYLNSRLNKSMPNLRQGLFYVIPINRTSRTLVKTLD